MIGVFGGVCKSSTSALRQALAAIPLFAGLPAAHLGEIARASRKVELLKDEAIFRVGEPARELFHVLSGQVKRATFSVGGSERVLELLLAGQSFGEAELFGAQPYASFAVAVEPTFLLCIGGDSVRRALESEPQLALGIIDALARRALDTENDTAAGHFRTGCQRTLDYLLSLTETPLEPAGQTVLMLPASKQLIASRIGMTPETLSRALRDLSDVGMIVVDGRTIRLQNARILARMTQANPTQPIFPRKSRLRGQASNGIRFALPGDSTTPTLAAAINMAGRQRMLSQRMAKSWLLLGRGVQPGRSRKILEQSAELFESQMAALTHVADSAEVCAAQANVGALWQPYRSLLDSTPDPSGARHLFDLNEAMLAAAHEMTAAYEKAAATAQGRLINLAGRQRMLSQRMAKFYLFQQWDIQVASSRAGLAQAEREFVAALAELHAATHDNPQIEAQLELLSQHWQLLQAAIAATAPADPRRRAATVATASERLLKQAEIAASLYEELAG